MVVVALYGWLVEMDREDALEAIDMATARLLRSVERFSDLDVELPSSLPGWTRGHVLAHVSQSADAMRNLLVSAQTGKVIAAYASEQARDAAIEEAARSGAVALFAELSASAERFRAEAAGLSDHAWQWQVRVLGGAEFPAVQLLERRLVEVVLHHTDLDAGYGPQHWETKFVELYLPEPMRSQRESRRRAITQRPTRAT